MNTRVYFIGCERDGAVKIGVADNPRARLSSLQTGSTQPLTLLAEMPGDERYERVLHAAFADLRLHGEWFRMDGQLAEFIALLPAMSPEAGKLPRVREPRDIGPTPDECAVVERATKRLYALIVDSVLEIGADRFAAIVGTNRGDVMRAMHHRGRRFPVEWSIALMQVVDEAHRIEIANAFLEPMGLRVLTKQDREARERDQRLRDGIISILGPTDGRKFLDQFDADLASEELRRMPLGPPARRRSARPHVSLTTQLTETP